jgi:hypothetical protein
MSSEELRRAIELPAERGSGRWNPAWPICLSATSARSPGPYRCCRTRSWRRGAGGAAGR